MERQCVRLEGDCDRPTPAAIYLLCVTDSFDLPIWPVHIFNLWVRNQMSHWQRWREGRRLMLWCGMTQGSTCKTSTHNQYHPSPPISMENISSSSLDFQISLNWFIMCISTGFPSFSCRTIDMPASTNLIVLWTGCQTWVCEAVNLLAWI